MEGTMTLSVAAVEKSADDLRREIEELNRQQRELTDRLRDPRGLRKGASLAGSRNVGPGAGPQRLLGRGLNQRGAVRRGDAIDAEDQPPTKKRLLSAVVKVNGDAPDDGLDEQKNESDQAHETKDTVTLGEPDDDSKAESLRFSNERKDFRGRERGFGEQENHTAEPLPRIIPKIDDPNVAKRNRRMFTALLGTLEKFREEDQKLSGSEAFIRRSTSQRRAEQRAQEESERLRQQERKELAVKRKRDLVLRARLAAKAEEKQLELLFIKWTEHHTSLCPFLRTKAEPSIFYMPAKPSEDTDKLLEGRKEEFAEWKTNRRAELSEYQRQATADHIAKVNADIERWQAGGTQAQNVEVTGVVAEDAEEHEDDTGDGERAHGRHGWRRSRVSVVSDNVEDQRDDTLADDEEGDGEAGVAEAKESDAGDGLDGKEGSDGGALKDVMGYGSGDDDMEER